MIMNTTGFAFDLREVNDHLKKNNNFFLKMLLETNCLEYIFLMIAHTYPLSDIIEVRIV